MYFSHRLFIIRTCKFCLGLGVMKDKYLQKKCALCQEYKTLQTMRAAISSKEEELDTDGRGSLVVLLLGFSAATGKCEQE